MLGTGEVPEIVDAIGGATRAGTAPLHVLSALQHPALQHPALQSPGTTAPCPTYIYDADTPRVLATPRHYAYVKIAEGCDYKCAFCIIPTLRGALPQPARRLDRPRSARARGARRQGAAAHLAGHDLLRHRPARARRARAAAARAERGRRPRVDPAALPLPDDDRRRHAGGDGGLRQGLQVHRPAAAARVEPGAQADEAARHAAAATTGCSRASAHACPASPSAPRSSSASRARPRPTSTSCAASSATTRSTTSGVFTYSHEEGTSALPARRRRAGGGRRRARRKRVWPAEAAGPEAAAGRIGQRVRVMVDGPSARPRAGPEGAAVHPGARHRRVGLPDRMRPVELPGRRFCSRSRSSGPADYDLMRARPSRPQPRAIILRSEPGCRTEWACAHFFSLGA